MIQNRRRRNKRSKRSHPRQTPRSVIPIVVPNKMTVRMVYQDSSDMRLSAPSLSYSFFTMRANSVFDPDPLILSGGISGFSEWGGLFRSYRVTKVRVRWEVINDLNNPPITFCVVPGFGSSLPSTRSALINTFENRFASKSVSISAAGGMDRAVINYNLNLSRYIGNRVYMSDRDYTGFFGSGATNPLLIVSLFFLAYCPSTMTISNAVVSNLRLEYTVQMYERQILSG